MLALTILVSAAIGYGAKKTHFWEFSVDRLLEVRYEPKSLFAWWNWEDFSFVPTVRVPPRAMYSRNCLALLNRAWSEEVDEWM